MKQVQSKALDIRQFIDDQPFSAFQLQTVIICGILVFMDGFDAQAMGYVAPALTAQFGITRGALGPVLSSGLVGMMVGALISGPIADRFGRKPVLVISAIIFGLGALITATATSIESLIAFRLLTGLGLGGAMPNAIALTSEYAPKRIRATTVMTMFCGFSIGAAVGGFVAAGLISRFGWQSVFVVGGVFPVLIGIGAIFALPESIRFLVVSGKNREKAVAYLSKIAPKSAPFGELTPGADEHGSSGSFVVKELFSDGRAVVTMLIWVMFFMNLLNLYFLNSWLPTVMSDNGIAVQTAILVTTLFQIGGAVGTLLLGRVVDRFLTFTVLAWTYLFAGICIFLIGESGATVSFLIMSVFAAGFCVVGGQTASNALTAEFYPTAMRSTGVGWALGVGRVGSIIGPTLGGVLLSMADETRQVFWAAAMPPVIAMVAAFAAAYFLKKAKSR